MNKCKTLFSLGALLTLYSCSSVENCNSAEVQELLMMSVKQEMSLQVGEEQAEKMGYQVKNIKHKAEVEKPDRTNHECFAELLMSGEEEEAVNARPLSYTVIRHHKDGKLRIKIDRI